MWVDTIIIVLKVRQELKLTSVLRIMFFTRAPHTYLQYTYICDRTNNQSIYIQVYIVDVECQSRNYFFTSCSYADNAPHCNCTQIMGWYTRPLHWAGGELNLIIGLAVCTCIEFWSEEY